MRSYGPRVDLDTGELHARVSQAHAYSRKTVLREERIAGALVRTYLIRSPSPGTRRLIQLHATYTDRDGDQVDRYINCRDELDEAAQKRFLEQEILAAQHHGLALP